MEDTVLNYYADGMSGKQIAKELGNSERTIDTHRSRILRKLHAKSITHAVGVYARAGLLYINQETV